MNEPTLTTSTLSYAAPLSVVGRCRVDWVDFFRIHRKLHGIRIRVPGFQSTSPEGRTIEKRLIRIVRARCEGRSFFALRRSFSSGPAVIDCVFSDVAVADDVARDIGAELFKPLVGWATGRELVADDVKLRQLLKMGEASSTCLPKRAPVAPRRPASASAPSPAVPDRPTAVGEALNRIAQLSPEQQATALFQSMMGNLER